MNDEKQKMEVTVTNFDMPFFSMVGLMVKFTVAALPAAMVVGFLSVLAISVFNVAFVAK